MKNIMTIKIINFLLVSLVLAGQFVAAKTTSKKAFLPKSFKATFKQTYRSELSGTIKSSTGKIDYLFPGHIRFETKKPDNIIFVSNRYKTWYYTAPFFKGEKGELSIKKASKNILTRFFDALKYGLVTNDLYTVKKIKNKNSYLMIFSKQHQKAIGMKQANLSFNSPKISFNNLFEISLTYLDKKKIRLTLSKVQSNFKFKKGYFSFKSPKNTKITRH